MEKRNCIVCGKEFESSQEQVKICSKKCRNKEYNARRRKEYSSGNGRRKNKRSKVPVSPSHRITRSTIPDAITLDVQLLKAVKKSAVIDFVKNDLPKMIEERFA